MPLTFQVESWFDVKAEAMPLWSLHWEEVGRDKVNMRLDPDIELLDAIARIGRLHIVTVRSDGVLAGYHSSFIERLPSYKTILASQGHVYWLSKEKRGPGVFKRLLAEVQRSCKERGVKVLDDGTKMNASQQRLYEHCGYRPTDIRMSKWIGDP